jgi:hypothetical protein
VKGWAANVVADLNRTKHVVHAEYNCLDLEDENRKLARCVCVCGGGGGRGENENLG